MQLFLCHTILGNKATLSEEESLHCVKVLRKKVGDTIYLIDGIGGFYKATITDAHAKACEVSIIEEKQNFKKRNYHLHIVIAPTKNIDRIEWFVEKAVELGVDEISFIQCQTSERKVIKIDRVKKIVEAAVKQSVQAYMPVVNEMIPFKKIIENTKGDASLKLMAHCMDGETKTINELVSPKQTVVCLIGPEGDFTKDELEMAMNNGFKALSLGENRLRTETAGLYICNAMSLININS